MNFSWFKCDADCRKGVNAVVLAVLALQKVSQSSSPPLAGAAGAGAVAFLAGALWISCGAFALKAGDCGAAAILGRGVDAAIGLLGGARRGAAANCAGR